MPQAVSVAQLTTQLAQGKVAPVYLLIGEEDLLRDAALSQLKQSLLGDGGDDFNCDVFYGDEAEGAQIVSCASEIAGDRIAGARIRDESVIRPLENAYSQSGGLAVLFGNLAREGAVVKTAGIDPGMRRFTGSALCFDSQDEAIAGILAGKVTPGSVVVIRYEGPKGGPGMQEM